MLYNRHCVGNDEITGDMLVRLIRTLNLAFVGNIRLIASALLFVFSVIHISAQDIVTTFSGNNSIVGNGEVASLHSVRISDKYTFVTIELVPTRNKSRMTYYTSGFTYIQSGPLKIRLLGALSDDGEHYHSCEPDEWGWSNVKKGERYRYTLVFDGRPPAGMTDFNLIDNYTEFHGYSFYGYTINNPDHIKKSGLTEVDVRRIIEKNNDGICGIYEGINNGYRLGCIPSDGGYDIIYLGHSQKPSWWHVGDVKSSIAATSDVGIFSGYWYSLAKERIDRVYVAYNGNEMRSLIAGNEGAFKKVFPDSQGTYGKWSGTGFAIKDGYIVTNEHVIEGAKSIVVERVIGTKRESFSAEVVGVDKGNDLAVLKIDIGGRNWNVPYSIKTSTSRVGEDCFALGFPLTSTMGLEIKLTNGIISALSGYKGEVSTYQISVPVQPGNSGGPVFNKRGELIGIINAKHNGAENVSYAIKTSYLNNLIESITSKRILPSTNILSSKSLPDQVSIITPYVFYIKCE